MPSGVGPKTGPRDRTLLAAGYITVWRGGEFSCRVNDQKAVHKAAADEHLVFKSSAVGKVEIDFPVILSQTDPQPDYRAFLVIVRMPFYFCDA